jgi:NAD(P)-dependent dehydrogenase (short-subunit alcohol dehydrogenase family)
MGRLQDKVTIITGGASGMGRVAARMFAAEGAKVVVADVTAPAAQSVVDEVTAAGGQAIAVVADVSTEADAKRMIEETVAAFGRVDVH